MSARTIVLHVEDDPNDALLFAHACRRAGASFELKAVGDGDQAIAYLRGIDAFADRQRHPFPQLVLLDLKMPRTSGFDVLTWVREQEAFKGLPVIVLTSSQHDADVKRAYTLGANSYLVKPVNFESLVELAKTIQGYWVGLNE